MEDPKSRDRIALLDAPRGDQAVAAASVDLSYVCAACAAPWPYQDVRNTGRCPTCGSGLRRAAER